MTLVAELENDTGEGEDEGSELPRGIEMVVLVRVRLAVIEAPAVAPVVVVVAVSGGPPASTAAAVVCERPAVFVLVTPEKEPDVEKVPASQFILAHPVTFSSHLDPIGQQKPSRAPLHTSPPKQVAPRQMGMSFSNEQVVPVVQQPLLEGQAYSFAPQSPERFCRLARGFEGLGA